MKPKLSVLMPAKRTKRWLGLWESINNSFSESWELLLGTSQTVPPEILEKPNVLLHHHIGHLYINSRSYYVVQGESTSQP